MIARKVHNHIPINELTNKYFDKYIVSRKEIKRGSNIWNIDKLDLSVDDLQNAKAMADAAETSKNLKCNIKISTHQAKINKIKEKIQTSWVGEPPPYDTAL